MADDASDYLADDLDYREQYTTNLPVVQRPRRWRWVRRGLAAFILLFVLAVGWLADYRAACRNR